MRVKRDFRMAFAGAGLGVLFLGIAATAMAADEPEWVRQFGTVATDAANGVATDAEGNVYLAGQTGGSLAGPNRGGYDVWVAKYNPAGQRLWRQQFGTDAYESANGVAIDAKGNVYLSGYTEGALVDTNGGAADAWLAKFDSQGRKLWSRQFGTQGNDVAFAPATDGQGNVYLIGYTEGSLGGDHRGSLDAWVAKYGPSGKLLWRQQLGTEADDLAAGVATDATGNVFVAGYTEGSLVRTNLGGADVWLAKYDPAGRPLWRRQFGTKENEVAYVPATDAKGNVYLTGYTGGSLGGANQGWTDVWVAKYDPSGHVLWRQQLGTVAIDHAWGAATDEEGNVYLTGYTEGPLAGFPNGFYDAWVAAYDGGGRLLWMNQLGSYRWDNASGVATDRAGNVYVTGYTNDLLGRVHFGGFDAWFAKYSAPGYSAPAGSASSVSTSAAPPRGASAQVGNARDPFRVHALTGQPPANGASLLPR